MDALADGARFVPRLAGFVRHPGPPSQHSRAIAATRQIGIGAVLGLSGRTIDLNLFVMRPFDVLGTAKTAVREIVLRKAAARAGSRARSLRGSRRNEERSRSLSWA